MRVVFSSTFLFGSYWLFKETIDFRYLECGAYFEFRSIFVSVNRRSVCDSILSVAKISSEARKPKGI